MIPFGAGVLRLEKGRKQMKAGVQENRVGASLHGHLPFHWCVYAILCRGRNIAPWNQDGETGKYGESTSCLTIA